MMQKEDQVYRESHVRSIIKAVSWRCIATGTTFGIVFVVTGKLTFATSVAGVEVVAKMVFYYLHERAWQWLPRGTVRRWLRKRRGGPHRGEGT